MTNRSGRSIPVSPFHPEGVLPDGLLAVSRPDGGELAATSESFASLARKTGAIADRQAADAGERAGIDAAQNADPHEAAPLTGASTIYGRAFDNGAIHEHAWRLETAVNQDLASAFEELQGDPAKLDQKLDQLKQAYVDGGHYGDPENRSMLDRVFDAKAGAYRIRSRELARDRAVAARRAAATDLVASQRGDLERQAYLLPQGKEGDDALGALTQRALNQIDVMQRTGLISADAAKSEKRSIGKGTVKARLQGVFDALPDGEAKMTFANGLRDSWAKDPASPLKGLDFETVDSLADGFATDARRASAASTAASAAAKSDMSSVIADDVASIQATGKEVTVNGAPLDTARVAAVLGPAKAEKWQADRKEAQQLFTATGDFQVMSDEAIADRLDSLRPAGGGEGFAVRQEIFEKAQKRADALVKVRRDDPAGAVSAAFDSVRQAEKAANPDDPASLEAMIKARLDAQAALDIPELARAPLTKKEALALSREVLAAPKGEKQLQAMQDLGATIGERYGSYGDEVMTQLLTVRGIDRELAGYGAALIRKLGIGERPSGKDARAADKAGETAAADAAMDGRQRPSVNEQLGLTPEQGRQAAQAALNEARSGKGPDLGNGPVLLRTPTAAAIARLQADPTLAPQFDEIFGPGTSSIYLKGGK